jgi:thiamine-phosphate pyrophosphorylase
MAEAKPKCRLYLQLPVSVTGKREAQFAQMLANTGAACVLICPGAEPADESHAGRLIDLVHAGGPACLVENEVELAARLGADGVHIEPDPQAYRRARDRLGIEANIGVRCGSKHEAMLLAEMGADYVAFGGTPDTGGDRLAEIVAWWSEMFVVPCVVWNVDDPAEAELLARLGADFVAPSIKIWQDAATPALVEEIARAIGQVRRAA